MSSDDGVPVGRRVVLGALGLGALALAFGRRLSDAEQAVLGVVGPRDPTGLTQLIPAGAGFRFYSVTGSIPRRTAAEVRIGIGGLVAAPRTWTMPELARLPQTSLVRDFQCVTGWRVPSVTWSGVALPDLLAAARPRPAATAVRFVSYDGSYSESLTLDQARRRDVLVATGLQGKPISSAHGGPVRLAVLPMYGYKSLKWLDRIELTADVEPGYWEHRGYEVDGWVGRSNGRSDDPTS
ncbi:MAG TPA: molybdopterin-dependent oxidoreductase [Mycobacteriales bacterium]|nr:molybdopterin-dependent oxidoreductase [Mycobacteriales bacterium]